MARVFIDVHMFSEEWFKKILPELVENPSVTFVHGDIKKFQDEIKKVRTALTFFKTITNSKDKKNKSRRIDAPKSDLDKHYQFLTEERCFKGCSDCDDAHIFAIIYVKPTPYVFSKDDRLARCRDKINAKIDSRYCNFSVLGTRNLYDLHKHAIHA